MSKRRTLFTIAFLGLLALSLGLAGCMPAMTPQPPAAGDPASGPALTWEREGGIAGFCDELTVSADGTVTGHNCKGSVEQEGKLTDEQRAQLGTWLSQLKSFEYEHSDPATADAMTVRVTLAGLGGAAATPEDQQAIEAFAARVYAGLMPITGPTPTPEVFNPAPEDARATDAAREALAQKLGVSIEDMTVGDVTAEQWRNSCLGLAGADEMCLQVITPGFKVMLTVNGQEYEVRTNQDATVVRIAE